MGLPPKGVATHASHSELLFCFVCCARESGSEHEGNGPLWEPRQVACTRILAKEDSQLAATQLPYIYWVKVKRWLTGTQRADSCYSVTSVLEVAKKVAKAAFIPRKAVKKVGKRNVLQRAPGPHTVVVAKSGLLERASLCEIRGALYTMGTCHKGLLCNLGAKDGAFGRQADLPWPPLGPLRPWDELRPYRVGGPLRNPTDSPLSPLGLAPPYDAVGPVVSAVSAHIHSAILCADGKAWVSWRSARIYFCIFCGA